MESKFSQNLKYLRSEKSLAQSQLAEMLNYTQSNISEWEKGTVEPKATAIITISEFFGVTADYLLGLEDDFGIRTAAPSSATAGEPLTAEERKVLEQYRNLPEQLRKLIRQQLDVYSSPEELLFKPDKKV